MTTDSIRVALQISLLGEIYPDIRAIAYSYDLSNKIFTLRYYLVREPIEEDYENVSIVLAEFASNFNHTSFNGLKEECIYSKVPKSELDSLDGFVYFRKE